MRTRNEKTGRYQSVSLPAHKEEGDFPGGGKWTIERVRQQVPDKGDHVIIRGMIYLLAEGDNARRLDHAIIFGNRARIIDEGLYSNWGLPGEKEGYRGSTFLVEAATWKKGFAQAKERIAAEANVLSTIIDARVKALEDAEL